MARATTALACLLLSARGMRGAPLCIPSLQGGQKGQTGMVATRGSLISFCRTAFWGAKWHLLLGIQANALQMHTHTSSPDVRACPLAGGCAKSRALRQCASLSTRLRTASTATLVTPVATAAWGDALTFQSVVASTARCGGTWHLSPGETARHRMARGGGISLAALRCGWALEKKKTGRILGLV
eukprot:05606_5